MEYLTIFKDSPVTSLLSSDGITATSSAIIATNNIKQAAKDKSVFITYWHNGKVTFESIYTHTQKIPAKALRDLESFQAWNIDRINHFYIIDGQKCGIL